MLFDPAIEDNVLLAFPDPGIADAIDTLQRSVLIAACAGTVAVLGARWWAASGPRRRALLPTLARLVRAVGLHRAADQRRRLGDALADGPVDRVLLARHRPDGLPRGLLRSRLTRGGLADLFRRLGGLRGAELRRRWGARWAIPGWSSRTAACLACSDGRSVRPVERDGRRLAALVYDSSLDDDPELVEAVSAAAAIALENERLLAESQARLAELQASRERIVAAGDAERRRLERDLHDGAQQRLVALAMQLRLIQADIRRDPAAAEALVTTASGQLAESLQELRELARGIHPAVLQSGLPSALESLAARSRRADRGLCELASRSRSRSQLAVYFVACEALDQRGQVRGGDDRLRPPDAHAGRDSGGDRRRRARRGRARPRGAGCAGSPTAWRRWAAACSSRARRAPGPS